MVHISACDPTVAFAEARIAIQIYVPPKDILKLGYNIIRHVLYLFFHEAPRDLTLDFTFVTGN